MMTIFDNRPCHLGEGPLWHPLRQQLFWFDITARRLLSRDGDTALEWQFDEMVSAAAWIDHDHLLIASETALGRFDLTTGQRTPLCALEADNPATRSNDGRADPQGGFWIGTMGKRAEPGAGAIYRYAGGEFRRLYKGITIPNAICFAPDGKTACFTDTETRRVMRVALDAQGWPRGQPETWLDLQAEGLNPDGAVIDANGNLWLAEWGASRIACHSPQGDLLQVVPSAAPHTSCPAFGGADMHTLFCTTALQGMGHAEQAAFPLSGQTFRTRVQAKGQTEHRFRPDPAV